jgi:hypothetical protein
MYDWVKHFGKQTGWSKVSLCLCFFPPIQLHRGENTMADWRMVENVKKMDECAKHRHADTQTQLSHPVGGGRKEVACSSNKRRATQPSGLATRTNNKNSNKD